MVDAVFPLSGTLISGASAFSWLSTALLTPQANVYVCSAFLRSETLSLLAKSIPLETTVHILARWRLGDLLVGASDLSAYQIAKARGWHFYLRLDFHGKVYAVPNLGILVGSANATTPGMATGRTPNMEVCTVAPASVENLHFVQDLFYDATLVTPGLFSDIEAVVENAESLENDQKACPSEWPKMLLDQFHALGPVGGLLVSECFHANLNDYIGQDPAQPQLVAHDLECIGFTAAHSLEALDIVTVRLRFVRTRMARWLCEKLAENGGELYFGALTAKLHSALLDDPSPRRFEIKKMVQNLLSWIVVLELAEFLVDQPNHSQRIRLKKYVSEALV